MSDAFQELYEAQLDGDYADNVNAFSPLFDDVDDDAVDGFSDAEATAKEAVDAITDALYIFDDLQFQGAALDMLAKWAAGPRNLMCLTTSEDCCQQSVYNFAIPSNMPGHVLHLPMIDAGEACK